MNVTEAQLMSACFSYDHSFGLQSPTVRLEMVEDAKRWWKIVDESGIDLQQTPQCVEEVLSTLSQESVNNYEAKSWVWAIIKEVTQPSYLSKQPEKLNNLLVGTEEQNYSNPFFG